MAFSGSGSLMLIDEAADDSSSWMNSEVYRRKMSAQVQPSVAKPIGWRFTVQMDNDPKPANVIQEL